MCFNSVKSSSVIIHLDVDERYYRLLILKKRLLEEERRASEFCSENKKDFSLKSNFIWLVFVCLFVSFFLKEIDLFFYL